MACDYIVRWLAVELGTSSCQSYLGAHFAATVVTFNPVVAEFRLQITLAAHTWFTNMTTCHTAETGHRVSLQV